ncbi:MAG: TIGR01212 family radical SAM protein [Clostridia bacterium]
MKWLDKWYHTLDYEMKKIFGQKVIKLSLDGGFTCPNRDGRISSRGCIFCSEKGAGDFAGSRDQNILEQMAQQKQLLSKKWSKAKYIAYFQSFTNTYAPVEKLRMQYETALSAENVVGLAIATRPDCLPPDVLTLLREMADRTFLWLELGLQTIHPKTATFIRRGYDLQCFIEAMNRLKKLNIRVVVHLIVGLPGESRDDILETVRFVASLGVWGVKLHMLYIQRDTDLYEYYCAHPFPLLGYDEYIALIADSLELLPPETVVHRVTGDGARKLLAAPLWSLNKPRVLAGIDRELRERGSYQGCKWKTGSA